jgi:hypothetical protein
MTPRNDHQAHSAIFKALLLYLFAVAVGISVMGCTAALPSTESKTPPTIGETDLQAVYSQLATMGGGKVVCAGFGIVSGSNLRIPRRSRREAGP